MKTKSPTLSDAARRVAPAGPSAGAHRTVPRRLRGMLMAAVAGLAATACAPSPEMYNIPAEALVATPRNALAIGDVVRLSYAGAPEFNQTQKVQPDGRISLPRVGSVTASGRSVTALQDSLTAMYKPHLNDSTVMVSLEQPAAAVYVSGAVNQPGKVPLDRSLTALEAVMEAGGFSPIANPKQVFVLRTEGGRQKRYPLNMEQALAGFETRAFYLRPYDVIWVKKSNW